MSRLTKNLILAVVTVLSGVVTTNQPSYSYTTGTRFSCERKGDEYFTFLRTEDSKKYQVMKFASTDFPPPYNKIRNRCEEISSRFQRSYDNGTLKKIIVGRLNNQSVVCAVKYNYDVCDRSNLLFTLTNKAKGKDIANRLFNIAEKDSRKVLTANGSDNIMIDFDRYLESLPRE
ncbi:COP23 domain-containing protein [Dolichospermum lemmermannii CS-548]|jgi:hypothetical protein|uniref:COP23 domain-containing protein n=1 Tax=Dolichospermum lemmermannii TaxID=54295 RepID=UPI002330CDDE|nr:COP23 domain-containing protein [Dolichospermum lemmermannii]MDB9437733.1 COP23 domain-containing protein [Dolichospermum lemmermannii CS-548]